jgi:hypothetical protein
MNAESFLAEDQLASQEELCSMELMLSSHTCPVAMKMAVTMFAACALKPPMLPATAEPTRFLEIFTSTRACTVVLRIEHTTSAGTTASHTTDFPRPSILQHHRFV